MSMHSITTEWLEACESTSKLLKERLRDQFSEPVAIASATQTAGTGRLGAAWQSLPGNLHLSVAIPARYLVADVLPMLPMAVGVVMADWLKEASGVACCLKWPNDLLIDGKKFGGILCEGIYHGQDFLGAVIGIGINLTKNPPPQDSYATTSLQDALAWSMPPRLAADQIVARLLRDMVGWTRQDIASRWIRYAMRPGHYWQASSTAQWWRYKGIDADGGLVLEAVAGAENTKFKASKDSENFKDFEASTVTIKSVGHDFRWSMQMKIPMLVADVGNTRVKLALMSLDSSGEPQIIEDLSAETDASLQDFLARARTAGAPHLIHATSVNPQSFQTWQRRLLESGFDMRPINKEPVRATRSLYDLEAIGADRLAILEVAHFYHDLGRLPWPAMLVSLGTATTIDMLDGAGLHLGGYIAAGVETALKAVANRGALLPKNIVPQTMKTEHLWPRHSEDAMTAATYAATLAFLKSERVRLAEASQVDPQTVPVLLTGGFAEPIQKLWDDQSVVLAPALVLKGTMMMALNGR